MLNFNLPLETLERNEEVIQNAIDALNKLYMIGDNPDVVTSSICKTLETLRSYLKDTEDDIEKFEAEWNDDDYNYIIGEQMNEMDFFESLIKISLED